MALVQLGTIISNIKGSIGGTTFSASRAGTVAKKRVTGKRLLTTNQFSALNTSKILTNGWNSLTAAQQNEFNAYALVNAFTDRYGVTKQLSGFQWYKQLAYAKYYWEDSIMIAPPAYATPAALPTFDVITESDSIHFAWSTPIDPSELYLYLFSTPPIRQNMRLSRSTYRLTDIRSLDYSNTFNLTAAWEQAHKLSWNAVAASAKMNINVLVVPINKTSFVSGNAQSSIGSYSTLASGIGTMIIGSTFVVE